MCCFDASLLQHQTLLSVQPAGAMPEVKHTLILSSILLRLTVHFWQRKSLCMYTTNEINIYSVGWQLLVPDDFSWAPSSVVKFRGADCTTCKSSSTIDYLEQDIRLIVPVCAVRGWIRCAPIHTFIKLSFVLGTELLDTALVFWLVFVVT